MSVEQAGTPPQRPVVALYVQPGVVVQYVDESELQLAYSFTQPPVEFHVQPGQYSYAGFPQYVDSWQSELAQLYVGVPEQAEVVELVQPGQ